MNSHYCGVILTDPSFEIADGLAGPAWLKKARQSAVAALGGIPSPTTTEENWRYSRIDDLSLDQFALVTEFEHGVALPGVVSDLVESSGDRTALVATRDGHVTEVEVDEQLAAKGLRVLSASSRGEDAGFDPIVNPSDYFINLNTALTADPILIDVPDGVVAQNPIVVVHWISSEGGLTCPRVTVRVGENAQATVVEYFVSEDIAAVTVPVTEFKVSPAANLHYVAVQSLGPRVWQMASQISRVDKDATLQSTAVALGGHYARVSTESHLVGTGATSKLNAVYFGSDSQMHDFRTLQAHDAPKTTSDLLFKGAVGGEARSVYSGLIRVRKGAAGTNAFQTNRNLVLSPGAHADSVPNLEIEENDVRCSHASAVGPIDEEQRYYLESRGVPADIAERLIVMGFLDELLVRIPLKGIHPLLKAAVAQKLHNLDEKVSQ